jgi:hypothetical protein
MRYGKGSVIWADRGPQPHRRRARRRGTTGSPACPLGRTGRRQARHPRHHCRRRASGGSRRQGRRRGYSRRVRSRGRSDRSWDRPEPRPARRKRDGSEYVSSGRFHGQEPRVAQESSATASRIAVLWSSKNPLHVTLIPKDLTPTAQPLDVQLQMLDVTEPTTAGSTLCRRAPARRSSSRTSPCARPA